MPTLWIQSNSERKSSDTHKISTCRPKVPMPQCEYKATKRGNLQTHINSVHIGQKFNCPQCEHKATQRGHLQTHIKSVHEGQKFKASKK